MAMIRDAELFRTLEANAEALLRFEEPVLLGDVIRRSIELKGEVVGADERESGLRIILNYGHTIGHALEAATGYRHLLHGEAVAIGMRGAGFIARERGTLPASRLRRPAGAARTVWVARPGGRRRWPTDLLGPLSRDKKARGSTIQWVLSRRHRQRHDGAGRDARRARSGASRDRLQLKPRLVPIRLPR